MLSFSSPVCLKTRVSPYFSDLYGAPVGIMAKRILKCCRVLVALKIRQGLKRPVYFHLILKHLIHLVFFRKHHLWGK